MQGLFVVSYSITAWCHSPDDYDLTLDILSDSGYTVPMYKINLDFETDFSNEI